mmetsp:Transcript_19339/g.39154  ORF Transcript_19339/g.39154 Transcript_19339/m.39154 type:complete len:322 (-) Transcript_19339:397-1362(-)
MADEAAKLPEGGEPGLAVEKNKNTTPEAEGANLPDAPAALPEGKHDPKPDDTSGKPAGNTKEREAKGERKEEAAKTAGGAAKDSSVELPESVRALVDRAKELDAAKDHFLVRARPQTVTFKKFEGVAEATSPKKKGVKDFKYINIRTFVDPYPYREIAQELPPQAKHPKTTNWFGYTGLVLNMGNVLQSHTPHYKYKLTVKSRYLASLNLNVSFTKAPFIHGKFHGTKLAPGNEHTTIISFYGPQKPGERYGYVGITATTEYGEEKVLIPVYAKVIKPGTEEAHPTNLRIPRHAMKLFENTGKIERSKTLAFAQVVSRPWN